MTIKVDPELLQEVKSYGAFDISACFNCGNCSAVCPLSESNYSFPRKIIRHGQLGDIQNLLAAPEIWLCYNCGECSETCPREANPSEYMAALRRFAIGSYEPTGTAKIMQKYFIPSTLITLLLTIIFGTFLITVKASEESFIKYSHWLFNLVPYDVIHNVGVGVGAIATISILWSIWNMFNQIKRFGNKNLSFKLPFVFNAAKNTLLEIATMNRHKECAKEKQKWYMTPRYVHLAIMMGFLMLALATALNFLFIVALPLNIQVFYPARVIGTIGGVVMLYGVIVAMYRRLMKTETTYKHSQFNDWTILIVLFVLGITGYWLEFVVTFKTPDFINDIVLLVHAAMAMTMVTAIMNSKLAHVLYRPLALFYYFLGKETNK